MSKVAEPEEPELHARNFWPCGARSSAKVGTASKRPPHFSCTARSFCRLPVEMLPVGFNAGT